MAGASSEDGVENSAALVAVAGGGGVVEETPAAEGSAAVAGTDGRQEDFPAGTLEEMEEDEEDRWVGQYSSTQSILLVGEGDFSFSLALATGFGSGENLVATSPDRYDTLKKKYSRAESNLAKLKEMGAVMLHGVDAKTMQRHTDLRMRLFDRVVFNFPHAGFLGREDRRPRNHLSCGEHRAVVKAFFCSVSRLLRPDGEVHVSHKTKYPYNVWDIPGLAAKFSLNLLEQADFHIADYPGYSNKRGHGSSCDQPFELGDCSTYKFKKGYRKRISRPRLVPLQSIGSGGVYPNSSVVSGGCRPSYPPPAALAWQFSIPINTFGIPSGSGFSHYDANKRFENGSVHQNISAASGGCRPWHPPLLAPEWPRPYPSFGMPPGSGLPYYDCATQRRQQGFDPQQNSNMAGIIPHDDQEYQRQRTFIAQYGRQ